MNESEATIFLYGEHHATALLQVLLRFRRAVDLLLVLDPRHRTTVWYLQTFVLRFDGEG